MARKPLTEAQREAQRIYNAAWRKVPENKARTKARMATNYALPENKARAAMRASLPENKARKAISRALPKNKARAAAYRALPENKASEVARHALPENKARAAARRALPENKAREMARRALPENKARAVMSKNSPKYKTAQVAYHKANPGISRAIRHRRRASELAASGTHTADDIKRIGSAQGWRCGVCAKRCAKAYHVDHVTPLSKGGSNGPDNLSILCPTCNLQKGAKLPLDFARERGLLL